MSHLIFGLLDLGCALLHKIDVSKIHKNSSQKIKLKIDLYKKTVMPSCPRGKFRLGKMGTARDNSRTQNSFTRTNGDTARLPQSLMQKNEASTRRRRCLVLGETYDRGSSNGTGKSRRSAVPNIKWLLTLIGPSYLHQTRNNKSMYKIYN